MSFFYAENKKDVKKYNSFFDNLIFENVPINKLRETNLENVVSIGLRSCRIEPSLGKSNHIVEKITYFTDTEFLETNKGLSIPKTDLKFKYDSIIAATRSFEQGKISFRGIKEKLGIINSDKYFFEKDKRLSFEQTLTKNPKTLDLESSQANQVYLLTKENYKEIKNNLNKNY